MHVDHPIRFGYLLHMVRVEASADCLTRVWGLTMDVRAYLRADAENRWVTVLPCAFPWTRHSTLWQHVADIAATACRPSVP